MPDDKCQYNQPAVKHPPGEPIIMTIPCLRLIFLISAGAMFAAPHPHRNPHISMQRYTNSQNNLQSVQKPAQSVQSVGIYIKRLRALENKQIARQMKDDVENQA